MKFHGISNNQLVFLGIPVFSLIRISSCATATITLSKKFQTIEGFGGGLVFGVTPYGRGDKDELYDSLFNNAKCNAVRIENLFGHTDTGIQEVPMMKEIQQKWPQVKVMLTGWSPPKNLKSNDTTAGKVGSTWTSIKKNSGAFMYDEYGDWWKNSESI